MSLAVIKSIPVDSSLVPSFLENIIDRRIANLALNVLEELIDWICGWLYFPYHQLYQQKNARIHTFRDGLTSLIDGTKKGIARIQCDWAADYISLYRIKVLLTPNQNIQFTFSKQANTDYVIVVDDEKRGPGWYKIIEQEISRPYNPRPMQKCWHINTKQIHLLPTDSCMGREAYLVEQPHASHKPT